MTTPTPMTTSMIRTATTMMTNVVVVPSLERAVVGCMLLLTGTVPVVVVAPTVWGEAVAPIVWRGEVVPTVWGGEVVPTVWGGEVVPTVWRGEVAPTVWGGEVVPTVWGEAVAPTVWGGEVVPTVWGGEVAPPVWEGKVAPIVWEGVVPLEIDAVGMKYTGGIAFQMDGNTTHITLKHVKLITTSIILLCNGTQTRCTHIS